jgi:N-acetylmuramoyl-L-alanine amidase
MSDVAIVVGHHPNAPGATLDLAGYSISEYELWKPFARELASTLAANDVDAAVVERPNVDPDAALAERVNATEVKAAIELHFNDASREAHGTEMFHWPTSDGGRRLATLLQQRVTDELGTTWRRVEGKDEYPFLRLTEMPAVICEPAFGSHSQDAWTLLTGQVNLLRAYRNALSEYLEAPPV